MPEVVPEKPEVSKFIPDDYDYWNDQPLQEAIDFVYQWYETLLPKHIDSPAFINFAIRSRELANRVSPGTPMEVTRKSAAFTDGKKLYLPVGYLLPAFYRSIGIPREDDPAAAIAAINGSQIHEALHCYFGLYSWPKVLDDYRTDKKGILARASGPRVVDASLIKLHLIAGFLTCLNLIADVAIEAACQSVWPVLYDFVICKNELLLGHRFITEVLKELEADPKVDKVLETLFISKNEAAAVELVRRQPGLQQYFDIINKARTPSAANYADVVNIAFELFNELMKNEESEGSEFVKDVQESDNQFADSVAGSMEQEMMKAIMEAFGAGKMDSDGEEGTPEDDSLENEMTVRRMMESFYKEMDKMEQKDAPPVKIDYSKLGKVNEGLPKVHLVDINEWPGLDAKPLDSVTKWKAFGNLLKYARHETKNRGVPKDKGRKLIKHRIAHLVTDNKLFRTPTDVGTKRGQPEVVILCDVSGSMRSGRGRLESGKAADLMTCVVNAAHGMHLSLMNASINNIVVAHTTSGKVPNTTAYGAGPIMYGIASYSMPFFSTYARTTGDTANRFGRLLSVDCNENFDGLAVLKAGELFTKSLSSKVLLVLSDGQPSAPGYSGSSALSHTKMAAAKLRKDGIAVISISLTEGVMDTNNNIYGKKNNIAAYGDNFQKAVHGIVQMIAEANKE